MRKGEIVLKRISWVNDVDSIVVFADVYCDSILRTVWEDMLD